MALYVRQQQDRTELQKRVAAELREKIRSGENEAELTYEKPIDSVQEGTHESRQLGPVLVLIAAVIGLFLVYVIFGR